MVTGTTRSAGAASIITGSGAPERWREELGVAGEGEAGAVLQRLLVDRVGAERQRRAGADDPDAAGDDVDDRGGVRRIRLAGRGRTGQGVREDRQARRQRGGGLGGAAIGRTGRPSPAASAAM